MDLYELAVAKALSGGGGVEPVIEALSVTENGEYTAPSGVDGYSPVTVNVSGGGGAEIEAGTFSVAEDTREMFVQFSKTHDSMPTAVFVQIQTDSLVEQNTFAGCYYVNADSCFGTPFVARKTGDIYEYGRVIFVERTTLDYIGGGTQKLSKSNDETPPAATSYAYPRNWVLETGFFVRSTTSSVYIRSGSTFKWTAIWV